MNLRNSPSVESENRGKLFVAKVNLAVGKITLGSRPLCSTVIAPPEIYDF